MGTESRLHDDSWISPTVIATLGAAVAPMKTAIIDLDVTTPATDAELPLFEELVLDDGANKFGDITLALTVVPALEGDESGENGDEADMADEAGGCSTGGGGGGASLLLVIGLVVARRSRLRP
jgi:hypothetical protein